jgi:hypothetical protein
MYHKYQNFGKKLFGTLVAATKCVLTISGTPADTWLRALTYVCLWLNHLGSTALGLKLPLQVMTGQTPDIWEFSNFSFFEALYYHTYADTFPYASNEE